MKWPSESRDTIVEIYWRAGDAQFVCGVQGWITKEAIRDIEREFMESAGNCMGDGSYLFRATPLLQTDTTPAGWLLDRLGFRPFAAA